MRPVRLQGSSQVDITATEMNLCDKNSGKIRGDLMVILNVTMAWEFWRCDLPRVKDRAGKVTWLFFNWTYFVEKEK